MQKLVLLTLATVTSVQYLISVGWLPSVMAYVPELLSLVVVMYVMARGVQDRFTFVGPAYFVLLAFFLICVLCGAIANRLDAGPMFVGTRTYLRALPFFLLPSVWRIVDKHLRAQLLLLLAVCIVQLPIAVVQRLETPSFVSFTGLEATSGDYTFGTVMNSGMLTLFLAGAACVLSGMFIRKRIGAFSYLILLLWILMPTAINETKITVIAVPVALVATFIVGTRSGERGKYIAIGLGVTVGFLALFVPIYDYFVRPRWGYGILDFFTMEGRVEGYLMSGVQIGDEEVGGRFDAVPAILTVFQQDPVRFLFGTGIGNATESALGPGFAGRYASLFENFRLSSMNYVLLELGLLGLVLVVALHALIARDAVFVARRSAGLTSDFAVGWVGVSVVMLIGFVYTAPVLNMVLSYVFWFFSGLIMSARRRLELDAGLHSPVYLQQTI